MDRAGAPHISTNKLPSLRIARPRLDDTCFEAHLAPRNPGQDRMMESGFCGDVGTGMVGVFAILRFWGRWGRDRLKYDG